MRRDIMVRIKDITINKTDTKRSLALQLKGMASQSSPTEPFREMDRARLSMITLCPQ